jgi:hypothetical protein
VNIEDEPAVSSQTPAAVSASVPSDAVAGQRNDSGPDEGATQQIIRPEIAQAVGIPSPAAAAKMNEDCGSGGAP